MDNERPVGLTLLALANTALGFVLCAAVYLLVVKDARPTLPLVDLQLPFWVPLVAAGVAALWSLGAGLEMWMGRHWGWWLALTFYLHLAVQGIVVLAELTVGIEYVTESTALVWLAIGGMVLLMIPPYLYLWRHNVREYFDLTDIHKPTATMAALGVAVVLTILAHVLYLSVGTEREAEVLAKDKATAQLRLLLGVRPMDSPQELVVTGTLHCGPRLWAHIRLQEPMIAVQSNRPINPLPTHEESAPQIMVLTDAQAKYALWQSLRPAGGVVSSLVLPEVRDATPEETAALMKLAPFAIEDGSPCSTAIWPDRRLVVLFHRAMDDDSRYEPLLAELLTDASPAGDTAEPGAPDSPLLPGPSPTP